MIHRAVPAGSDFVRKRYHGLNDRTVSRMPAIYAGPGRPTHGDRVMRARSSPMGSCRCTCEQIPITPSVAVPDRHEQTGNEYEQHRMNVHRDGVPASPLIVARHGDPIEFHSQHCGHKIDAAGMANRFIRSPLNQWYLDAERYGRKHSPRTRHSLAQAEPWQPVRSMASDCCIGSHKRGPLVKMDGDRQLSGREKF